MEETDVAPVVGRDAVEGRKGIRVGIVVVVQSEADGVPIDRHLGFVIVGDGDVEIRALGPPGDVELAHAVVDVALAVSPEVEGVILAVGVVAVIERGIVVFVGVAIVVDVVEGKGSLAESHDDAVVVAALEDEVAAVGPIGAGLGVAVVFHHHVAPVGPEVDFRVVGRTAEVPADDGGRIVPSIVEVDARVERGVPPVGKVGVGVVAFPDEEAFFRGEARSGPGLVEEPEVEGNFLFPVASVVGVDGQGPLAGNRGVFLKGREIGPVEVVGGLEADLSQVFFGVGVGWPDVPVGYGAEEIAAVLVAIFD